MRKSIPRKRRGQMLVFFAFSLILLAGICVLAIDIGRFFVCKAQLQNAVDAASLAGASQLTGVVGTASKEDARAEAVAIAQENIVASTPLHLAEEDVQFGHYDDDTGEFVPEDEAGVVDSMRVRGRRTVGSPDGPIGSLFGGIFGLDQVEYRGVVGVGTKPRRYVMFVLDRSGSMCYDTQGIDEEHSPVWDSEEGTYRMKKSSSGWYALPQEMHIGSWETAYFYALDDDTGEVRTDFLPDSVADTLVSDKYWKFENPEGQNWPSLLWAPSDVTIYSAYDTSYWDMYYYGPFDQCDYATMSSPVQPMQSTVDAASAFTDLLRPADDRAGLVTYATSGSMESTLTSDFDSLKQHLSGIPPAGGTGEPDGMDRALDEMVDSGRADGFGQRIMILLTDGNANYSNGNDYGNGNYSYDFMGETVNTRIHPTVGEAMEQQTKRAASNGVRIYTVSFGDSADQQLHQRIAEVTNGAYYYSQDHEDLTDIFIDIFRRLPPIITM